MRRGGFGRELICGELDGTRAGSALAFRRWTGNGGLGSRNEKGKREEEAKANIFTERQAERRQERSRKRLHHLLPKPEA